MSRYFVDTGYLIALESADDQHHAAASRHWRALVSPTLRLVTTSFVIGELVTFFSSRGRHAKAVEIARRLTTSPSVELVQVDEKLFRDALDLFSRRPDKRFSLTDCISFVLMDQRGLREALAFDAHFEQAGFERLPR